MHIAQHIGSRVLIIKQHNRGTLVVVQCKSIINQLYFPPCWWNIYSAHLLTVQLKLLWCRVSVCGTPTPNYWPARDGESIQTLISLPIPSLPSLHVFTPPCLFFHHLPHLCLQCCRSEPVYGRGMYVHTNTGRAAIFSSKPTKSTRCPLSGFFYKQGNQH